MSLEKSLKDAGVVVLPCDKKANWRRGNHETQARVLPVFTQDSKLAYALVDESENTGWSGNLVNFFTTEADAWQVAEAEILR